MERVRTLNLQEFDHRAMPRAFVAIVNVQDRRSPFWKIMPVDEADDLLDELREKFSSPKRRHYFLVEALGDGEG